ncbi:MAG: tetratricopeptide repeat protein [Myxococcales bacterium]|nr:tetratricopeptide repeat protein [Myxococcales bacterium]
MAGSRRRVSTSLLSLVSLAAVAAGADADATRYQRTTPVKVPVTTRDRARPPRPPADAAAPTRPLTADDALAIHGKLVPIHQQQIDLLRELITQSAHADVNEQADLHFRLAELHGQNSRYHRLKATELAIAADRAAAGAKAQLRRDAQDHRGQAAAAQRDAVATYRALADEPRYRGYPRMDKTLFALAYTLAQAGDGSASREVYKRLLDDHPQSPYVPEAYLAFADYFFGVDQLDNAEAFYRKVLQFPSAKVYAYATYRLGWVFLNQGRPDDAGRQFLQVARDTAGDAAQATLHNAALNDFVRAYADFGQVQRAWPAFQKIEPARAQALLARLAELYVEQGKNDKAIFALRQLIKVAPGDADVCAWQADVARATLALPGATVADRADEIARLVRLWGALAKTAQLPAAAARACKDDAAAMAGELARAWHSEGAKAKDPALLDGAGRLYDAYLAQFDRAPDAGETAYYRAELGWLRADGEPDARRKTVRWRDAAAAFTAVVKRGDVAPGLVKESADAAVRALKNALDVDPRPRLEPIDADADARAPTPRPIPETERALLAAMDDYLTYVKDPADPERVGMLFLQGDLYRRFGHAELAIPRFTALIEDHPGHETAYYAAHLLLNLLITTHQDAEVTRWAAYFAAHPRFLTAGGDQDRSELGRRVAEIQVIDARRRAEALERTAKASGDLRAFVACGAAYLELFNKDPEAARADELLWNAGLCFEQGRSLSIAIETFTELRARFPTSPQAAKALARLGGVYAKVAYYDRAAGMFEEYARKHAGAADARDLMNDAVLYRKGTGDDAQAVADTTYFISKFTRGQPAVAADAFWSLAAIYEQRGDTAATLDHYRAYLRRYREAGGSAKVVIAHARIGQLLWAQSCPVAGVDGSCVKVTRERAVAVRGRARAALAAVRTQCGPDTKIKLTVIARDPGKVKQAQAAFAAAVAAYEAGARRSGADDKIARHYYAQARFQQAEVDYEAFLALRFPQGLDFDARHPAVAARSMTRFEQWYGAKDQRSGAIARRYVALVKEVRDPATAIAAAARFGQLQQNFADALFTAEIPADLRPYEEAVDQYCATLEARAEPLVDAALVGYGQCLQASTDFGWFSSWSKLCERELGQLKPEAFPTAVELRAAPEAEAPIADVEPRIAALE